MRKWSEWAAWQVLDLNNDLPGVGGTANLPPCPHGNLTRSCEVCELQAENARLADNRRFWMETANSRSAEIIRLAARVAELEGDYERGLNDSTRPLAVGNAKLAARVKKLESAINKHRDALIESGLTAEDARENKKHFDELESTR